MIKRRTKLVKFASLLCGISLLATSFTACGSKNEVTSASTSTAVTSTATTTAGTAAKTYDEKITFTMNAIDADKAGKDADGNEGKVFKWLKQKFNFDIEWIPVTWNDYALEKPQLWMASGEQPDIMMLDIAAPRYPTFLSWVKDEQFRAYPDLANYPNMKKAMDTAINGTKFLVDGKLMAWPSFMDTMEYGNLRLLATRYRIDWAEKVGLRQPNDEYTYEQWIELCTAILAQDPGGNGAGKTIGMISEDWVFPRFFGPRSLSPDMLTYTKRDGKWVWGAALPETLDAIKEVRKLYDNGLIWKDQPMVKAEDPLNKFNSGTLFAHVLGGATFADMKQRKLDFINANPGVDADKAIGYATIKGMDGKLFTEQQSDHWTETAMSASLSDVKADRWMDILEYLVSEEGYYVRNCGIPGEDFTLENGKLEVKWPKDANGIPVRPVELEQNSWQWAVRAGISDNFMLKLPATDTVSLETAKRLIERVSKDDVTIYPYNVDLNYFSAPNYDKVGTQEKEIFNKIAEIMVKKDYVNEWNSWIKSMEPKIAPVLEELNNTLK